jgi:fructose-bisphosphate aldolase class I
MRCRLMKPIPSLDALLTRVMKLGIFGTKLRFAICMPSAEGIAALVRLQFVLAMHIANLAYAHRSGILFRVDRP